MKIWIIECVENLTDNWHPEGGIAVIAESLDAAKKLILAETETDFQGNVFTPKVTDEEWAESVEMELAGNIEERVFIFPNAGCC